MGVMTLEGIKAELKKMVPGFAAKIHPIYEFLEWKWSRGRTTLYVPSLGELENALRELIDGLTEEYVADGSGGLEVYYEMPDENGPGVYGLSFKIEEQKSFDR